MYADLCQTVEVGRRKYQVYAGIQVVKLRNKTVLKLPLQNSLKLFWVKDLLLETSSNVTLNNCQNYIIFLMMNKN